jgi:hypothetical protein
VSEPDYLEPTRLELLADDAGMAPDEYREWLRGEIARQDAARTDARTDLSRTAPIRPG